MQENIWESKGKIYFQSISQSISQTLQLDKMTSLTVLNRQCERGSRGQDREGRREEKPVANAESLPKEESWCRSGNLVRSTLPLREEGGSGGQM